MPFVAGDSWDYCVELENPQRGAAAVEASGGCSGEAWPEMPAAMWDHQRLLRLHLVAAAPGLVHLVLAAAVVLSALHPGLGDHPWDSAASASDAGAVGVLLLVRGSWGSPAAVPSVLVDPVVLLAAAGDLQLSHHWAGIGMMGVHLAGLD